MTFVNAGTLGTVPGRRDDLVALLTERNDTLQELGCRLYEVGVNADEPDTVFVVELWESEGAPGLARAPRRPGVDRVRASDPVR